MHWALLFSLATAAPGGAALRYRTPSRPVVFGERFSLSLVLTVPRGPTPRLESLSNPPILPGTLRVRDDRPEAPRPERRGRRLRYVLWRQDVLALAPGPIQVPPSEVRLRRAGGRSQTLRTPAATVRVRPAPRAGQPDEFQQGWIGPLRLSLRVESPPAFAGAPGTLRLTIDGPQPFDHLAPPRIEHPTIQARPSQVEQSEAAEGFRLDVRYSFRAEGAGQHALGPLSLPYYEPDRARYGVARSNALRIQTAPAPATRPPPLVVTAAPEETPTAPFRWRGRHWMAFAVPPLIFAWSRHRRRGRTGAPQAPQNLKRAARDAARLLQRGQAADAHAQWDRALRAFAFDGANAPGTTGEVGVALRAIGCSDRFCRRAVQSLRWAQSVFAESAEHPDPAIVIDTWRALARAAPAEARPRPDAPAPAGDSEAEATR